MPVWEARPTANEICRRDPSHFRRSGYGKLRVDGNWYRCHLCIFSHPDRNYVSGKGHPQTFHGIDLPEHSKARKNFKRQLHVVSRAEGERLTQMLRDWQRAENAAGRPKTPYDEFRMPQQGAMPLPTAPLNLQGLAAAPAVIVPAPVPPTNVPAAPPANVPSIPAANAPPMAPSGNANNQQRPVTRHMCYMCKRLFASRAAVKNHALSIHATRLIQEPFQPGRVPAVEIDAVTKQPVKLVSKSLLQAPGFLLVCEELRELFYKELLTIPTAMQHGRDEYDKHIFQVFSLSKSIAGQTMPLFSKWNFLIQISISSYEEDDLDNFERTIARDFQVVPSGLEPKLGEPALSISIHLLSESRLRRTRRRVQALVIYTEQSLIDLVELINRHVGILEALKVDFASYASAERFGSIKRMIKQYLGYLRNIPDLLWYDSGSVINNKTTQRMRGSEPQNLEEREEKRTRDLRRLTITLQEQIRRRMVGPARMTEFWLLTCQQIDVVVSRERMLGPNEGTEQSRRLQCARKQAMSDFLLARLQLLELRQQCEPLIEQFPDPFEPSRNLYQTYKEIKSQIFTFPGVPDSFRADAHLYMGIVASRIARDMLDVRNKWDQSITSHSLDRDFLDTIHNYYGRLLVGGVVYAYESDSRSDSDGESMEDDRSEQSVQSEESEHASEEEENPTGSDADSEVSNSTRPSRSPSSPESYPTYDTLWGSRDPDAESNTSGQTLSGNRRYSGSDADDFSLYDTAMEGLLQENRTDFAAGGFGNRSAMSSTAAPWDDGDAMEDVQHSNRGSLSEHFVDEAMEDIRQSLTGDLNEPIPSSDGENSADEDGYDTDDMSTTTESTIRPRRRRRSDNDETASETSTYVPPPNVHIFAPNRFHDLEEELVQDKLVTPPFSVTAPAVLARFAIHHFYYADNLYLNIRDGDSNNTVTTTTTVQNTLATVNPDDNVELPADEPLKMLLKAFDHELDWDEDMPVRPVKVSYGFGDHKPFQWAGAPALVEHWEAMYGKDVAFENMANWQKRPEGWEEEGEEMRRDIGRNLDAIVDMAKREGR